MSLCQRFNQSRSLNRCEICIRAAAKQEALPPMRKGFLTIPNPVSLCLFYFYLFLSLYLTIYLNSTIFLVSAKSPACRRQK